MSSSTFSNNQLMGMGMGGGLGSLLSAGLMNRGGKSTNPAQGAMSFLDRVPSELRQYLMPYIQQGQQAGGQLGNQYGQLAGLYPGIQNKMNDMQGFTNNLSGQFQNLTNDPTGMMNKIGAGYQQSPGFSFERDQALKAGQNAAAAGGYMGSPQHQQQSMDLANNFASRDYNNYVDKGLGQFGAGLQGLQGQQGAMNNQLQNLLGLYGKGISGMEHQNDMGYGASGDLATSLAQLLMSQGNLSYAGQANQNQMDQGHQGAMAGLFGSGIGSILSSLLMGGG